MAKLFKKKVNLGYKYGTEVTKVEKKSIHYPTFYVSKKKLPIEPEDVGKMLTATIQLKVTGVNMRTGEDKQSLNYDFEIHEIIFDNKKKEF